MRILITGSKGVVGLKLQETLRKDGHSVLGCGRSHSSDIYNINPTYIDQYMRCDIGEARQIERVLDWAKPDVVYNCAAEFGRWNGEAYYEQLWRTNVVGLKHILKEQDKRQFKLVHFSSSEVYGDWPNTMNEEVMEKEEIKQLNDYAISKWSNELQIGNHRKMNGNEIVTVRLFNTYGPGETYHPFRSVNCIFTYRLLHSYPIKVYAGHQRTSTYLPDATRTLANIVKNWKPGSVYNISSSTLHSIETLSELIREETNANPNLITIGQSESMTTMAKLTDNTLSVNNLGHVDTVTLAEGVKNTVAWMKEYYNL